MEIPEDSQSPAPHGPDDTDTTMTHRQLFYRLSFTSMGEMILVKYLCAGFRSRRIVNATHCVHAQISVSKVFGRFLFERYSALHAVTNLDTTHRSASAFHVPFDHSYCLE